MAERLNRTQTMVGEFGHEVLGNVLRVMYRFSSRLREPVITGMVDRVRANGYIDQLSQDELELLPKPVRRDVFARINLELISGRLRAQRGSDFIYEGGPKNG